jgi:hypothetical protein
MYLLGGADATCAAVAAIMAELLGVKAPRAVPAFVLKLLGRVNDWVSYLTRKEPDVTAAKAELVCSGGWTPPRPRRNSAFGQRHCARWSRSFRWLQQEKLL